MTPLYEGADKGSSKNNLLVIFGSHLWTRSYFVELIYERGLTRDARDDVRGLREYISAHSSKQTGRRVANHIGAIINVFGTFPRAGHRGHIEGTLEMVVPRVPFVIVYRIATDEEISILRVYHIARDR